MPRKKRGESIPSSNVSQNPGVEPLPPHAVALIVRFPRIPAGEYGGDLL